MRPDNFLFVFDCSARLRVSWDLFENKIVVEDSRKKFEEESLNTFGIQFGKTLASGLVGENASNYATLAELDNLDNYSQATTNQLLTLKMRNAHLHIHNIFDPIAENRL